MPFLVLYKELALLDTRIGMILLYTLMVLPIVDLDHARPVRHDPDRARAGGPRRRLLDLGSLLAASCCRSPCPAWSPPSSSSLILCWNEYFFAALLTSTNAKTLPVMVASQTGSQGINWWSMAALSTAAIAPLAIIGIFLERYIVKGLTAGAVK